MCISKYPCSSELDLAQSVQQLEYANERLHERNQKLQLQVNCSTIVCNIFIFQLVVVCGVCALSMYTWQTTFIIVYACILVFVTQMESSEERMSDITTENEDLKRKLRQ